MLIPRAEYVQIDTGMHHVDSRGIGMMERNQLLRFSGSDAVVTVARDYGATRV